MLRLWRWISWFVARAIATGGLLFTIQFMLHQEGYWIPTKNLVMSAMAIIIGVLIWVRGPSFDDEKRETSWSNEKGR